MGSKAIFRKHIYKKPASWLSPPFLESHPKIIQNKICFSDILPSIKLPKLSTTKIDWIKGSSLSGLRSLNPLQSFKNQNNLSSNTSSHKPNSNLSTVSSIVDSKKRNKIPINYDYKRENYGLYAMKCNRSAINKGVILNIPINRAIGTKKTQIYQNENMVHEKFSPCKKINKEIVQIVPPPRRKRKIAPQIPPQPQLKVIEVINNKKKIKLNIEAEPLNKNNLIKNKSELFRIAEYSNQDFCVKPPKRTKIKKSNRLIETKDSLDIFNKKTNENAFDDFDSYFQPIEEVNHFLKKNKKSVKLNDKIILHSYSPPSSISLPYDEICQEENFMDISRMTSTIQVQDFSGKNLYSHCKTPVNNKQIEENSIEFYLPNEKPFDSNRKIEKTKENLNNKDFEKTFFRNEINTNKNLVFPINKKLIVDEINEKNSMKNVTKNDLFDGDGVKKQKDINCYRNLENGDDIIDTNSIKNEMKFTDGLYSNENLRKITNEGILFLNLYDVRI